MKYLFYAIIFDVAGNITQVGSSTSPAKSITTNIQKVTSISINPNSAQTKNISDTFKITATVSPSDANNKGITWNSTSTSVATVDSSGNIRCLAAGTTTITATAADGSGKSASLELTVRNPINSLTLDKDQTTILKDGYTSAITATTDPSNYDASNISWTIADTSIATVTVSGKTANIKSTSKIGQTTLTVSASGITKTVNVSVVNFTTQTYSYTGTVQQVDLPAGKYKLECWGAEGEASSGNSNGDTKGGYGGYSSGIFTIENPISIYVCVGSQSGYNGGGKKGITYAGRNDSNMGGSGGGASHISTKAGLLNTLNGSQPTVLIVAGGGGGGSGTSHSYATPIKGSNGGGYIGNTDTTQVQTGGYWGKSGHGGTQTSGGDGGEVSQEGGNSGWCWSGKAGSFGQGGSGAIQTASDEDSVGTSGGGGGGWYGGGGGAVSHNGPGTGFGGGGGSGYINTSKLTDAFMYGYNVSTSSATATKTYSTTNVSSTPTSNYAKSGNGAVKITPVN